MRIIEFKNGKFGIQKTFTFLWVFTFYLDSYLDFKSLDYWWGKKDCSFLEGHCETTIEEVTEIYERLPE